MKTALYRTELIMRLFLPEDEFQEKVLHIRQELQVGENQWMPKFQDKREETCKFNSNSSINPTKQVWQNNMILLSGFQFDTWTYDNTMTKPITVLINRKGTYYNVVFLINCTRRCGPLRGPSSSSCGGLRPSAEAFFCPLGKKRSFYVCFGPNFGHFWISSNLSNF